MTTSKVRKAQKTANQLWIHVEVLENGVSMATCSRKARRGLELALGASSKEALVLPHFPLPDGRYVFLRWESGQLLLVVDLLWEGFCTSFGDTKVFQRAGGKERSAILAKGDYACIENGTLRIMVKIDTLAPERKTRRGKSFAQSADRTAFLNHFFPRREERFGLVGATLLASVVVGGLVFGLLMRPYAKPMSITEIKDDYMLPFVDSEHLRHAPEALQSQLNRAQLTRNTVVFYQSLTGMLMGWHKINSQLLFPTSLSLYQQLHAAMREEAQASLRRQKDSDAAQAEVDHQAVVALPAVVGESLHGSMLRVLDKITVMHTALALDLTAKRAVIEEFPKDPPYDFEEYRSINNAKKQAMEDLGKAVSKSFGQVSDEELMYAEADHLAQRALLVQRRLGLHKAKGPGFDEASPLAMPEDRRYATYVDDIDFLLADDKLLRLEASEYGLKPPPPPPKRREALTGEIEPALIERFIRQQRFQLQLCYELALRRNEGAAGTMEWQWRIDSRGVSSDVALVASAIKDQKMITCVRDKIGLWRFPRPRRGSVEVRYPFEFNPTKG